MSPASLLCVAALLALALALPSAQSPANGNFDCAAYDPHASLRSSNSCLANMHVEPHLYDVCRDDTNRTCYVFVQETPFVILNDIHNFNSSAAALPLQRPFRCGDFESELAHAGGIHGIAFELHKLTSSRDDWCMWAGHSDQCTFNQLVDFINVRAEQNYRFAVSGLLLEMPQRQCRNHPSAPFLDSVMIIIGRKGSEFGGSRGPFVQLIKPFHSGAWGIFAAVLLLFVVVCLAIAVRFHWFRGRSLITAFFIFTGERDQAMAHEAAQRRDSDSAADTVSFATKYGLSMSLFRIALLAFIAIFALFYEVAVVNFLFQQQNLSLSKPIRRLSTAQLADFAVLKESALENVWDATVRNGRNHQWDGAPPWQNCPTAIECIQSVQRGEATFMVTFEVVGKYLLMQHSSCSELSIFETQDVLYQFNGGWLYNFAVSEERRLQVDRELVGLRIEGRTMQLIDAALEGHTEECGKSNTLDIGPMIILIPCLVFVVPPLICSVLVLVLWKKKPPPRVEGDGGGLSHVGLAMAHAPKLNDACGTDSSSDLTIDLVESQLPRYAPYLAQSAMGR